MKARAARGRRILPLLLSAAVVIVGCAGQAAPAGAPSVARDIDPGGTPGRGLAFDFGSLWVPVGDKGTIARIDPASGKIAAAFAVSDLTRVPARAHVNHAAPLAVTSAFGAMWAIGADGLLARIDPTTKDVTTFDVGVVGGDIAASDTALWITAYDDGALVRFDPAARSVSATITGLGGLFGVAVGFGSVWVVNKTGHQVLRLDPTSGAVVARIPAERNPDFVTVGAGSVWVTRESPRAVLRIDPSANAVAATIPGESAWGQGTGIAFYDGAVWAGFLVRIDPATDKVTAAFAGTGVQEGLAFGAGSAWVADTTRVHQIPLALVR